MGKKVIFECDRCGATMQDADRKEYTVRDAATSFKLAVVVKEPLGDNSDICHKCITSVLLAGM